MKYYIILLVAMASLLYADKSVGQNCPKRLNTLLAAICKQDSAIALKNIETYINKCREDRFLPLVYLIQSEFYGNKGEHDIRVHALELALKAMNGPLDISNFTDKCSFLFNLSNDYILDNYIVYFKLGQANQKTNNFLRAISMLDSSKVEATKSSTCMDAKRQKETMLALEYSNCYLRLKDTLSAINNLLDCVIYGDDDISKMLVKRLKDLLLTQYSYQQIADEIEQSIANAQEFEIKSSGNFMFKNTRYSLFGRSIPNINMSLKQFNDFMKKNQNIKYLKSQ